MRQLWRDSGHVPSTTVAGRIGRTCVDLGPDLADFGLSQTLSTSPQIRSKPKSVQHWSKSPTTGRNPRHRMPSPDTCGRDAAKCWAQSEFPTVSTMVGTLAPSSAGIRPNWGQHRQNVGRCRPRSTSDAGQTQSEASVMTHQQKEKKPQRKAQREGDRGGGEDGG